MSKAEKLITENLAVWTSSVTGQTTAGRGSSNQREHYGIKKLRELILQLAFSGGLSQSDGGAKRSEWKKQTVEEVATELLPGFACGKSNQMQGGHIHLRTHNISTSGTLNFDLLVEIDPAKVDSKKASIAKGDVLFNNTNSQELVGKTSLVDKDYPYGFSNHLTRIRLKESVSPSFFVYYFKLLRDGGHFAKLCTRWINQAGINTKILKRETIPIPPLAEQRRIVAKVDELMALCDQLEQKQEDSVRTHATLVQTLLGSLTAASERGQFEQAWQRIASHFNTLFTTESSIDQLKQTILQLAVLGKLVEQDPEDEPAADLLERIKCERQDKLKALPAITDADIPFVLPNGWAWQRMGEVYLSSFYGPRFGKDEYVDEGIPTIRTTDMTAGGEIVLKNPPNVHVQSEEKLQQYRALPDDLLITRSGTIGMMAIFRGDYLAIPSAYLIRLRFPTCISVDFFFHLLRSPYGLDLLGLSIRSIGVPNVNATSMSKFVVPLPPLAEQHRIVAKVDELMALCEQLKANLKTAQAIQLNLADSLVEQAI